MLQRLVARLLDSAVRRWPAHLRDELAREWAAELHALGHEAGVAAPVRGWRQLRFAASLAVSRPPGAEPALVHWLRRASPAGTHAGWLLFAPMLVMVATTVALVPLQLVPFGWVIYTPVTVVLFSIENYLVVAGAAMLIGTALARRLLRRRSGQAASVAGCAWATLPAIGGLLVADGLARAANQVWVGGWFTVIAAGCLAVLLPPAAAGVAALSRRGRPWLALLSAGLSAVAVTLATLYVLVLLVPQRPAAAQGEPWWWVSYIYLEPYMYIVYTDAPDLLPVEVVLTRLPWFLLATVLLALAHAIRLARPLPAAVVPAPAAAGRPERAEVPALARSPWWHRVALAGAAYSTLAWAVTLTYLTPNIGVQNSWPSRITPDGRVLPTQPGGWPEWSTEEGRVWMHELQLSGIVCAVLCLLLAAAYRGRPLLPALAGSGVLLTVNMVVVREGWTEPRLLSWLAGGGLLLGIAAWSAARWWGTRRPARSPRRLVITISVLAAFLVPGSFFPRLYVQPGVQTPPVVLLVVVGLPTVLTVLAAMGVLATSRRRSRRPAWQLPAGLGLLLAIGGVLYYQLDGVLYRPTGENPLDTYVFMGPLLFGVPVAVWTIAAIRARPGRTWRFGLHLLLAPLLLVAGYLVAMATVIATSVLAGLVLFPMEYGRTYDGVAYVPGAVAFGLLLGYLTAVRLDRPEPAPAPAESPDGFIDLGYSQPEPA